MQSLSFTRWSRRGRPPKDAAQQRSADIRWGFVGVAALLVVFAVLGLRGMLYRGPAGGGKG